MSIVSYLPRIGLLDRRVPRTRHRAIDKAERLEFLLDGANILIKGLRLQLDDMERKHAEVVARIDERHAETVAGLERQVADLERRLDIRSFAEAAAAQTQELDVRDLRDRFTSGRVVSLHHSPQAASPTHVPSWAIRDNTT